MSEPILVFIALAGASLLGFLCSLAIAKLQMGTLSTENAQLGASIKDKEMALAQLKSESEARMMAVENLQKISQDIETQAFEKEKALNLLKLENAKLQEELTHLAENPVERIKEIDVIREVPILVFREISVPETRKEKAKKLMKAFKKGYLDEHGELQIVEEKGDEIF